MQKDSPKENEKNSWSEFVEATSITASGLVTSLTSAHFIEAGNDLVDKGTGVAVLGVGLLALKYGATQLRSQLKHDLEIDNRGSL